LLVTLSQYVWPAHWDALCFKHKFGVQEAYPLCWSLYALGLDAWLCKGKLSWNEVYPHNLVAAWIGMGINLLFISYMSYSAGLECWPISWLSLPIASGKPTETQDTDFIHLSKMFCTDYYILIYTYCHELMTPVESHGS
jgi:hypothetical protein